MGHFRDLYTAPYLTTKQWDISLTLYRGPSMPINKETLHTFCTLLSLPTAKGTLKRFHIKHPAFLIKLKKFRFNLNNTANNGTLNRI
jgi:hypothetical protein